jgi:biopolymer transport protein ExbD
MTWNVRHEGSPRSVQGLTLAQIIIGLRDGLWEPTDEVMGPNDRKWVAIETHPQLEAVADELEPTPPRYHPDETRLDMNPLIDVCLVLLIFFILTTTYVAIQKVVPMSFTTDAQKGKIATVNPGQVQNYMIRVEARPSRGDATRPVIKVEEEKAVGLDEFPQVLDSWVKRTHKHEMLLDVAGISWGMTVRIQDAAKGAGVNKIYLLSGKK